MDTGQAQYDRKSRSHSCECRNPRKNGYWDKPSMTERKEVRIMEELHYEY
jgi:hypothetical protein